jgi:hypothetical protein
MCNKLLLRNTRVHAHRWGYISILLGMLFDSWHLGVVKVDMLKYLEVAISGLKLANPADMTAESAPFVIEEAASLLAKCQIDKDKRSSSDQRGHTWDC